MDSMTRAKRIQEDPKRMVSIWENSLRNMQKQMDKEPDVKKKKEMAGRFGFAKARLDHYRKLI